MNIHTFNALHRRSLGWINQPDMHSETAFFSKWTAECNGVVEKERASNRASYKRHATRRRDDARRYRATVILDPLKAAEQRVKINAQRKLRAALNPQYRFGRQIRTRIWMAVHKAYGVKAAKTFELLGCSREDFLSYIEATWFPGMTWSNYGLHGWHIDHKTPLASFDLTKPDEQRRAFHFTNTRALWAKDNLSKGSRVTMEGVTR